MYIQVVKDDGTREIIQAENAVALFGDTSNFNIAVFSKNNAKDGDLVHDAVIPNMVTHAPILYINDANNRNIKLTRIINTLLFKIANDEKFLRICNTAKENQEIDFWGLMKGGE